MLDEREGGHGQSAGPQCVYVYILSGHVLAGIIVHANNIHI